MAAYAAVISLEHTINGLLNSTRISLVPSTKESLEVAYKETTSLQQVLERSNKSSSSRNRSSHERLDGLEGQIRDCAHKLEDVLEFHEYSSYSDGDAEEVMRHETTSFGEAVKKMEKDYIVELSRDDDEDDDAALGWSNIDFGVEMVGHSKLFIDTQNLLRRMRPDDLWFHVFCGKHGSGKSIGAKLAFEDLLGNSENFNFECWAWVTVGSSYELKEVLIRIIAQVDNLAGAAGYELLISQEEEKLSKSLYKILEKRRYIIVLDDVDDVELVNYLRNNSFPDESNGSIVFLTTNSTEVAYLNNSMHFLEPHPRFFEETAWHVMRQVVYGMKSAYFAEMEAASKKIIQNCRCCIISFAKTLMFLLKSEMTVEQWSKIAADAQNPIFLVRDEISEIRQMKIEMQYYNTKNVELISPMIKLYDDKIKKIMIPERFFSRMQIISFFGMSGIGKTTFGTKIFEDQLILSHFDHHVWINLGPKYHTEEILIDILAQVHLVIDKLQIKEDEKLLKNLLEQLSCKTCLIVLDDLWSKEPLLHLRNLFPNIKGTILVTTRLPKVAKFERDDSCFEIGLLDNEESWRLLHLKVFGGGLCSHELEKVGRKIAEMCDGLPLLIITVANQLLKVEISQEYWNNVASGKEKTVFKNAHHQISEAELPSYQSLPQYLKSCFLYMGVFREKFEIRTSDLTNLWISEGFLHSNFYQMEEDFVARCLCELVDRSLVMVQRKVYDNQIKTYRLHSIFWNLCNSQALKNKFFHAMNSYDDCSIESMESQRRLCIRSSVLLGMTYVQKSMASTTSAHSLLCVSPFQHYPIPLNFKLRLLRVMNVITIRLYEFPIEVVKLIHLKYLSLTCNGELPNSISNLWKLQYLIVKRYLNIKSSKNSSLLPMEIWDMKELEHLQIMEGCLPNPRDGTGLLKLSTLLDVSPQSCRKKVLKRIPNLARLGIRIELAPKNEGNPFRYLNCISSLRRLESLKCVVVNPQIGYDIVTPPAPLSMLPPSLRKLSLSGTGYPWEHMSIIGKLKNLEVLKLKNYAFQGTRWEMDHTSQFKKLKFLLLQDTNLEYWKLNTCCSAMDLEYLYIKHCYKLRELPITLVMGDNFRKIEIVDWNPLNMKWAEELTPLHLNDQINAHYSWLANTHQG